MRVAGSTLVAVERPPAESLPLLRELGFDRVELAFYEGWTAVGPRGIEDSQLMTLRQLDLEAVALNVGVEGLSRTAAMRAVADCLVHADALGVAVVTVQAEPALELAALVCAARAAGIILAVETHVGFVTESPAGALALLADVPGLGLTLDLSHYAFVGHELDEPDIGALVRRAGHVHYRDAAPGALQLKPGDGAIEPMSVMHRLHDCGYPGVVTVEYIDAPEDAAAALRLLEAA